MPRSHTGLSPEWDRNFDEVFTDLISHDDDLVRAEFTSLTRAYWPARPGRWTFPDEAQRGNSTDH